VQNAIALGTSPIVLGLGRFRWGNENYPDLDNISFADWFRSHGGSDGIKADVEPNCLCARFFIDCEKHFRWALTIFQLFAVRGPYETAMSLNIWKPRGKIHTRHGVFNFIY